MDIKISELLRHSVGLTFIFSKFSPFQYKFVLRLQELLNSFMLMFIALCFFNIQLKLILLGFIKKNLLFFKADAD